LVHVPSAMKDCAFGNGPTESGDRPRRRASVRASARPETRLAGVVKGKQ